MATTFIEHQPGISFPKEAQPYYSGGLRQRYKLDAFRPTVVEQPSEKYATVDYDVSEVTYNARTEARLRQGGLEKDVPVGWPKRLGGPLAWTKDDFKEDTEYILQITDADKSEIVEGLKHFKEQDLDAHEVDKDNFPLPKLANRLEKASDDVYNGRGFVIVRGLDPEAFEVKDLTTVYLGLSSYIAEKRGKQDQRGSMLMHVMQRDDSGVPNMDNLDKPFHTDTVCDCLCLVTRSCSAQGGRSILASAWTVYNELAVTRPDVIHTLAKPNWPFDTFGRIPPYYNRAVMYESDGKIIVNFSRRLLVGHPPTDPRTAGIPGLTEAQAEALDVVHFTARKHELKPRMEKGDLRFVNNMGVLHRREAFENDTDATRHLIRLWLDNKTKCWKLPAQLRLAWDRVFEDNERGEYWDLEPPRKNGVVIRLAGSCD